MARVLVLLVLLMLALPAGASARGVKGASVVVTECATSPIQTERSAGFEGRMRGRAGTRLQMRFSLQSQDRPGERFKRVDVPGWSQWMTADPDTTRYAYEKRVENLAAPAAYRAVVRFKWTRVDGKVLRVARVVSAVCEQPDLRPNLVPVSIRERQSGRYEVAIRNGGRSDAGPFSIVLTVNGDAQPAVLVDGLALQSRRDIEVAGPRCDAGSQISIVVDSGAAVDERNERDNAVSVPCSAPSR